VLVLLFLTLLPLVKLKHHKIASISNCGIVIILAIVVHMAVVRIPAVAIFYKFYFFKNVLEIRVRVSVILGEERGEERRGTLRNYLANTQAIHGL